MLRQFVLGVVPTSALLRISQLACACALLSLTACGGDDDGGASSAGGGAAGGAATTTSSGTGGSGAGAGGSGIGAGGSGAGGSSGVSCGDLPLCDDFEAYAEGGPPDAATWAVVTPNCSGTSTVAIDAAQAHSGTKSVRVSGEGGYCNHVFISNTAALAAIDGPIYGRFFVRFEDALGGGHTTFMAMKDTADGDRDLRMGGQNMILMWNRESDDATLPALSPVGTSMSIQPATDQWLCVEFMVDGPGALLETWVDGAGIEGLRIDGTPTPDVDQQWLNHPDWHPALVDLKLGWESYAGQPMTLWFDDVALGPQRIGCD